MNLAESECRPTKKDRPVVIVTLVLAAALGDFIEYNLFVARFKRQYSNDKPRSPNTAIDQCHGVTGRPLNDALERRAQRFAVDESVMRCGNPHAKFSVNSRETPKT
jgi:hypothetical protein